MAVPVALYRLTHMWGGLTPEQLVGSVQPNGDSIYTYSAGYICRNLPATVKLLLRSASAQGAAWLQGLLGTALGEPIVYPVAVSWVLGVALVLVLLAAALPQADTPLLPRRACAGRLGHRGPALSASRFFAALSWTPINYENDLRRAGALLAARAAAGARSFGQRPHVHGAAQRCAPGGAGNRLPHISGHPAGRGSLRGLADVINA